MDQTEKTAPEEKVNAQSAGAPAANPENAPQACGAENPNTDTCVENVSPAESISEAADRIEGEAAACAPACGDTCAESESPAESISEATDRIEGNEAVDGRPRKSPYAEMSKEQLLEALRAIVEAGNMSAHKEVAAIKQAFYIIRNRENDEAMLEHIDKGNQPESFSSQPDACETSFKTLLASFRDGRAEFLRAEESRLEANLEQRNAILAELTTLADDIDNINQHFSRFKELQQQFKDIKEIPATAETESWKNYQTVIELFYDRWKMNRELRDLDFKKNLEIKRQLIEDARPLAECGDVVAAFRKMRELQDVWRETGPVVKELRDEIWNEFHAIITAVNRRHQDYFEKRKEEEVANETVKAGLCERLEAIDFHSFKSLQAWDKATAEVLDIQKQWKATGFAPRRSNAILYSRYRAVCDAFFEAKAAYFRSAREAAASNLAAKTALCEKVEALKAGLTDDSNMRDITDQVIKLQAEWKTIGSVGRKYSDELWERFSGTCNYLFELRKEHQQATRKEETANLAAKRALIARLKELDETEGADAAPAQIRELQREWQSIGYVPRRNMDAVNGEYRELVDRLYKKYDMRRSRERMSRFEGRIGNIGGDNLSRERASLFDTLDRRRQELKNYENNMGFFNVKSSAGNSMVKELERKIAQLRGQIAELEKKIALVDQKAKEQ